VIDWKWILPNDLNQRTRRNPVMVEILNNQKELKRMIKEIENEKKIKNQIN